MIYYVLQGGEWVLNLKNSTTDMAKEASYYVSFKTEPTVKRLKEIFIELYIKDPNVKWDWDVNNEDAIMVTSIFKSKNKIEPVNL
tara:strand:- start:709 stop:963 length:255 start_codon:yes stop_codon:yes gene_type:complete